MLTLKNVKFEMSEYSNTTLTFLWIKIYLAQEKLLAMILS